MASPLQIEVALWYHTRPGNYDIGDIWGSEHIDCHSLLVEFGLLSRDERGNFHGTEALHVYAEALCNVPYPDQRWVIPKS